jgi:hypothetical protein
VLQGGVQTNFFINPITRTGEFMDYADDFTNLANSVTAQEDFLSFDFVFDGEVILIPGSGDAVSLTVNDDLTNLSLFRAVARGFQEVL